MHTRVCVCCYKDQRSQCTHKYKYVLYLECWNFTAYLYTYHFMIFIVCSYSHLFIYIYIAIDILVHGRGVYSVLWTKHIVIKWNASPRTNHLIQIYSHALTNTHIRSFAYPCRPLYAHKWSLIKLHVFRTLMFIKFRYDRTRKTR